MDHRQLAPVPDWREVGEIDQHPVARSSREMELLPDLARGGYALDPDRSQFGNPI